MQPPDNAYSVSPWKWLFARERYRCSEKERPKLTLRAGFQKEEEGGTGRDAREMVAGEVEGSEGGEQGEAREMGPDGLLDDRKQEQRLSRAWKRGEPERARESRERRVTWEFAGSHWMCSHEHGEEEDEGNQMEREEAGTWRDDLEIIRAKSSSSNGDQGMGGPLQR